ncbi:hypothetical protein T03_9265 [Trichinella britovi]|uniref:Uncharacterized protein n=1 Tax=Trichinella britovi TaxID=45882 RepID=A0A0V1C7E0_TRIBR|nr:hypothetical protein T03_9265 [Trichinella britovi]
MEFLLEILRRILVCVGNAYVALTEKERHRHFTSNLTVASFLRLMKAEDIDIAKTKQTFAYSLLQKSAPLTTLWSNSNTAIQKKAYKNHCLSLCITKSSDFEAIRNCYERSFREPTALKTSEKLPAEGRLKNQKYGHLDMLCGTRTLGLIYSDVVKKGILEEWRRKSAECFRGI